MATRIDPWGMARDADNPDSGKQAKSSVDYGPGGEHCHACKNFLELNETDETGQCRLVQGVIGAHCWCRLFEWMDGAKPRCPTG